MEKREKGSRDGKNKDKKEAGSYKQKFLKIDETLDEKTYLVAFNYLQINKHKI